MVVGCIHVGYLVHIQKGVQGMVQVIGIYVRGESVAVGVPQPLPKRIDDNFSL